MTRPRGFIDDWQPRQRSLDLLQQVEAIVAEYAMPLTIRQIFYRLVGRYGYDKTEQAYDRLGELLAKARRSRRLVRTRSATTASPAITRSASRTPSTSSIACEYRPKA
jgi:hypothetical protein